MIHSIEPPRTDQMTIEQLHRYFTNTWDLYEALFGALVSEDVFYTQPDPLRLPLVFYLGHTAAFYINKLVHTNLVSDSINGQFERIFEAGVDPAQPTELAARDWPTVKAVREYRNAVRQCVEHLLSSVRLQIPIGPTEPLWALLMAIEHDRIHFETSSVLIRQCSVNQVVAPSGWEIAPVEGLPIAEKWVDVAGGTVALGKDTDFPTFGWDNEYGLLKVEARPFQVSNTLVTNSQFLEFVHDGGYVEERFWTAEGWDWKQSAGLACPRFWRQEDGFFLYRTMYEEIEIPKTWPVEVTFHEASAYCRWYGQRARLATEVEFARLKAELQSETLDLMYLDNVNLNLRYGSPCPVGLCSEARTPGGIHDVIGNVWTWLADDFYPLPGFEPHRLYPHFSSPYFGKDHAMLLGGSWATTGTGASQFYRLWFRRGFFQHAGFRMTRDASD